MQISLVDSDIINETILSDFGDALRIHHGFSKEPFSKDKFEYVLEQTLNMNRPISRLASKGDRGHDITINGVPISLTTQTDKNTKEDKIRQCECSPYLILFLHIYGYTL